MCQITQSLKVWLLTYSLVRKDNLILFAFNAHFAKEQEYGTRANVYATYNILENMNTFHIEKTKVAVL